MTSEEMLALPIDQFTRQAWVRNSINQLRAKGQKFTILDVGGYKGKTQLFQPNDTVTVCDLFDIEEPGYVRGDGKTLPFNDNSFDFVVSFDTYEHVPRAQRLQFMKELNRVASQAVLIAAPFDSKKNGPVSQAERALNQYYKDLWGKDHPWLKEHIDYGVPSTAEIEELLSKLKLSFVSLPTNDLTMWMLTQTMYFSIELDRELLGRIDNMNRFFNRKFETYDRPVSTPYRHIYILSSQPQILKKVQAYLNALPEPEQNQAVFMAQALSTFGIKYRDVTNHMNYLEKETLRMGQELKKLHRHSPKYIAGKLAKKGRSS